MASRNVVAAVLVLLVALPKAVHAQQAPILTNATDGELLQAFKATFSNGNEKLSSWNGTEPCANIDNFGSASWLGVICDPISGRVTLV